MSSQFSFNPDVVTLEPLRLGVQAALPASMAASVELSTSPDAAVDHLVVSMRATVYAQRIADGTVTETRAVIVEAPATTWQMFKARHALSWWLGWLVRRRPVRKTALRREVSLTATWKGYATFPDSTIVISNDRLGAPVYQLMRETSWSER